MTILSAQSIRRLCNLRNMHLPPPPPLIYPFCERTRSHGRTYGLDSAGYDIRSAEDRLLWPLFGRARIDALEWFCIPNNLKMHICDKSTWARLFVTVQNTRAEPGWRGYLRLEITNHSWWFRRIRRGMPIAEVEFYLLDESTEQPYEGKYQDQARFQDAILEVTT